MREMKLYEVYFQTGEHELEYTLFVSPTGTQADAIEYLVKSGAVAEDIELRIESVSEFTTAYSSNGDPYKVVLA